MTQFTPPDFQTWFAEHRGQLLVFVAEAWAVRHDEPSSLGRTMDAHHARLRRLMREMYDRLVPPPAVPAASQETPANGTLPPVQQRLNGHANGHGNGIPRK